MRRIQKWGIALAAYSGHSVKYHRSLHQSCLSGKRQYSSDRPVDGLERRYPQQPVDISARYEA